MFVRIWLKGTHWNITIRHAITNRPNSAVNLGPGKKKYSDKYGRGFVLRRERERERERETDRQTDRQTEITQVLNLNLVRVLKNSFWRGSSYISTPIIPFEGHLSRE